MTDFKESLGRVAAGRALSEGEAHAAFAAMMAGAATPAQMGAFLMGLRVRGEAAAEIAGGVRAMMEKAVRVEAPAEAIDTCGTGGDGKGTWNISTAAALVAAGAGAKIAKHGNRALSSKSGSAEVLRELGVALDLSPARIAKCIREAGFGFMFAPAHHPAMKHAAPVRLEMGVRTIFNLIGPLANPAGVKRRLVGVPDRVWLRPFAEVLRSLGVEKAWIVHGSDGLDELTTTGPSHVVALEGGEIRTFEINPEEAGLERASPESLTGGDPAANAEAIRELLQGKAGAFRDIVILNAAATLIVAGRAGEIAEGAALAVKAIDAGAAQNALERLIVLSNETA